MSYTKTNWQNTPSTQTPISAANLNHMEQGIYDAAQTADSAQSGVDALDPRMDLVEERLDNLIPEGTPTQGNAELIDIRVGANGITYPDAGSAVRGQYTQLKSALTVFENLSLYGIASITPTMLNGKLVARGTGQIQNAAVPARYKASDYIEIPKEVKYFSTGYVSTPGTSSVDGYAFYDANKAYISGDTQRPADKVFVIPNDAVYLCITDYDYDEVHPVKTVTFYMTKYIRKRKVAMFGDSITWGRVGGVSGTVQTVNTFAHQLALKTGYTVDNFGVGDQGWVAIGGGTNAFGNVSSRDLTQYDVVTLQYGVNDSSATLGTLDDTSGTILGEMYHCVNYIMEQNPKCTVIILGQTNTKFGSAPDWNLNYIENRYTKFKQWCDKYHVIWIDTIHNSVFNGFNLASVIGDNTHPTEAGYKILSPYIASQIAQYI